MITLYTRIFQESVWLIDIFAIYFRFREKQADGRTSKDLILPVILVVVIGLIFAVIGMYLRFIRRRKKCSFFRKKGNISIDFDVIYCGFISFFLGMITKYISIQE